MTQKKKFKFHLKKIKNFLILFLLIIVSLFLSYKLVYFVAEKYFFDKLFYYKSIKHGYWVYGKKLDFSDFGERSFYNLELLYGSDSYIDGSSKSDGVFTIALIGDSFLWGQGVVWDKTVSQVLKLKMEEYFNVRIIYFANCGDSVVDYYLNYERAKKYYNPDFFIFLAVSNDIASGEWKFESYKTNDEIINLLAPCDEKYPNLPYRFDIKFNLDDPSTFDEHYDYIVSDAWKNDKNLCVLSEFSKKVRANNSLFLITDDYWSESKHYDEYVKRLEESGKKVISSAVAKNYSKYSSIWNKYHFNKLRVSKKDLHPSALAHEMYADVLLDYIKTEQIIPDKYKKYYSDRGVR